MELAFLTLLLKDGTDGVSGGATIDNEGVFETGLAKDRGRTNGIDERLKGGLVFIFPMEFATLSAKRDECVEGGGQSAEVLDIHAIKVEKAEEGA